MFRDKGTDALLAKLLIIAKPFFFPNEELIIEKIILVTSVSDPDLDPDPHGSACFWHPGSGSGSAIFLRIPDPGSLTPKT